MAWYTRDVVCNNNSTLPPSTFRVADLYPAWIIKVTSVVLRQGRCSKLCDLLIHGSIRTTCLSFVTNANCILGMSMRSHKNHRTYDNDALIPSYDYKKLKYSSVKKLCYIQCLLFFSRIKLSNNVPLNDMFSGTAQRHSIMIGVTLAVCLHNKLQTKRSRWITIEKKSKTIFMTINDNKCDSKETKRGRNDVNSFTWRLPNALTLRYICLMLSFTMLPNI